MKESNLKLAQKDIDEALKAVEEMESYINEGKEKNNLLFNSLKDLTADIASVNVLKKDNNINIKRERKKP